MRQVYLTIIATLIVTLTGCASKTSLVVAPEDWVFEDRAVHIHLQSPADLNAISGRPHSVAVGVFQLNDPNTFLGLAETKQGALQLLNAGRIDDTVAQFTRIILQPGEEKIATLPRAQGAKYIALISGYYGLNTELDIKVFDIPIKEAKRGFVDLALSSLGLIADEAKAVPDDIFIDVSMGRKSTKQFKLFREEEINILSSSGF
ncbi:type VI secretion system lipoprotein TssJ [Bermanella marisrubri]|uniref:Lipoprotein, putative n=1 Tax=Bermanella marisrubri TaxID=207949 RepID=Q1N510_9GAMM|nr:type VI secretion system lipoprotein TssJ [Bermanella marisrubri]EAT13268.1 lipoprotein, putative [Oceanobacter sp. RED65] [Bermanella marisrubri]QIZ84035.1 type VI secretion system lipoprotein TssJ [Bermanella marisrubri]